MKLPRPACAKKELFPGELKQGVAEREAIWPGGAERKFTQEALLDAESVLARIIGLGRRPATT